MVSRVQQRKQQQDRARRNFTEEFKAGAVRLVMDEHKTIAAVARDLDLTQSALNRWVKQAIADKNNGKTGLTTAEREELTELRRRVRILEEERTILKKGLAFFAKESK